MPTGGGFAFGAFQLDLRSQRLLRDGTIVPLRPRHFELLRELVAHAGDVVTKDRLFEVAWGSVAVEDNTLTQAISQLRSALEPRDPKRYIQTSSGYGYRFVEGVTPVDVRVDDADIHTMLAPHRAFVDGRAALETLERAQLRPARAMFADAVAMRPDDAKLHVGLAMASVLLFESTRAEPTPDHAALQLAVVHSREACRLAPDMAEAWATIGLVLERTGAHADALAALRRATTLEPNNWRHHLRLAIVAWGEERLRAAERTLELLPGCPTAHWLAATVYVARGAFALAERELANGLAASWVNGDAATRFPMVALHWLCGLLCLVRGDDEQALAAFERELALEARGHLYARECCANTGYAIGAIHLRRGDRELARAAFEECLARVPKHPMARVGLMILTDTDNEGGEEKGLNAGAAPAPAPSVDAAIARAALTVAHGDATAAARVVSAALAAAPAGNAGWLVPIEPLLDVRHATVAWGPVLALLRTRAS